MIDCLSVVHMLRGGSVDKRLKSTLLIVTISLMLLAVAISLKNVTNMQILPIFVVSVPKPPADAMKYSMYHDGPFEVAKVFGRSEGCRDVDGDTIRFTSDAAVTAGIDPRIVASVMAVESGCNQFAISPRGAIGLMQVMAKTWKDRFDFAGNVNLLNAKDNIRVGTKILAELVDRYGNTEGVRRYNGLGVNCTTCDTEYNSKVVAMAGRN